MSIKERQLENERQRILLRELRAGRYPNISTIQAEVARKFRVRPAGLPRFMVRPAVQQEVSSSKDYNAMMNEAHEDLTTAFQELTYHADRMMSLADYYDTEKNNVYLEARKMHRQMEELEEKLKDRGKREVIFDTFNDYVRLDFEGDLDRSLPGTDAFMDLRNGYGTLESVQNGKDKIDISKATVQVKAISAFTQLTELASPNNALNDMVNEAWRHQGILPEPTEGKIQVTVTFDEAIEMNIISLITQSPRGTKIALKTIREDGTTKTHLEQDVFGYAEWLFNRDKIKQMEFIFYKTEPDVTLGADYYYYFGLENLSVRNVEFVEESYITSAPHHINRIINKVSLQVDELIPPDTSIRYFIAEDEMDGIVEWRAIDTGGTVNFERFLLHDQEIDQTAYYYGDVHSLHNHHYYHVVDVLKHKPVARTIELYMGSMMAEVDERKFEAGEEFVPTLEQWKGIQEFDRKYVNIEDISGGHTMDVAAGVIGRMTMYITMKNDYLLMANPITLNDVTCTVYLNNMQIKGVAGDFTYALKAGQNKLEIIYYSHTGGEIAPNLSKTYLSSIGMLELFAQGEPMSEVTLYDLQNNTSKRDYTRFAIDNNQLIVNYNPLTINNGGDGVRYKLKYNYKKPGVKEQGYLRFMAILERKAKREDVTPILRSYKLIVE